MPYKPNFIKRLGNFFNNITYRRRIHNHPNADGFANIATIPEMGNQNSSARNQVIHSNNVQNTPIVSILNHPNADGFANIATIPGMGNQNSSARNQVIHSNNVQNTPIVSIQSQRTSPTGSQRTPTGSQRTSPTGSQRTSPTGSQRTPTGSQRTSPTGSQKTSTGSQKTSTGSQKTSTGSQKTSTGSQRTSTGSQRTSPTGSQKGKKRLRNAKPDHLTYMPDNVFDIILNNIFGHLSPFVLNNEVLLNLKSEKVALVKPLIKGRDLLSIEEILLRKIQVIDLQDITLNKDIINVLNMTVKYSTVETIILRNISFETNDDIYNFLQYLKTNTQIVRLILRKILITKTYFNDLIDSIGELNNITLFEFSNFDIIKDYVVETFVSNNNDILRYFVFSFVKTLIKLEKLEFIIFNNNNIQEIDYEDIFLHNYVIDEKYMKSPKHLVNGTNKMLYNIKTGNFNIKDTSDKDNYYMHIISSHYKKSESECIKRRCLVYHTNGNEDNKLKLSNFNSKIVKDGMKNLQKNILKILKTKITNLTLTNNPSGRSSSSSSRNGRSSGSTSGSTSESMQEAILANIIANRSSTPIRNSNSL